MDSGALKLFSMITIVCGYTATTQNDPIICGSSFFYFLLTILILYWDRHSIVDHLEKAHCFGINFGAACTLASNIDFLTHLAFFIWTLNLIRRAIIFR